MCALLPVLAEPPSLHSRCGLFWCQAYKVFLTHAGCLDRRAARVQGRGFALGRTWARHRFCAHACAQGREIAVRFGVASPGAAGNHVEPLAAVSPTPARPVRALLDLTAEVVAAAPASSEAALWVGVVAHAVLELADAEPRVARGAWEWLFGSSREGSFLDVCDLAGLDPTWVRCMAQRSLALSPEHADREPLLRPGCP